MHAAGRVNGGQPLGDLGADRGDDRGGRVAAAQLAEALEVVALHERAGDVGELLEVDPEVEQPRQPRRLRAVQLGQRLEARPRVDQADGVPQRLDHRALARLGADEERRPAAARAEDRLGAVAREVERREPVGRQLDGAAQVLERAGQLAGEQRGQVEAQLAGRAVGAEGGALAVVALGGLGARQREHGARELQRGLAVLVAAPVAVEEVLAPAPQHVLERGGRRLQHVGQAPHGRGPERRVHLLDAGRHDLGQVVGRDRAPLEQVRLDVLLGLLEPVGDVEQPLAVGQDLAEVGGVPGAARGQPAHQRHLRLGGLVAPRDRAPLLAVERLGLERVEVARPAGVDAAHLGEVVVDPVGEQVAPAAEAHDRVLVLEAGPLHEPLAQAGAGARREVGRLAALARAEQRREERLPLEVGQREQVARGVDRRVVVEEEAVEEVDEQAPLEPVLRHELRADPLAERLAVVVLAARLHQEPGLLEPDHQALEAALERLLEGGLELLGPPEGRAERGEQLVALGLVHLRAERLSDPAAEGRQRVAERVGGREGRHLRGSSRGATRRRSGASRGGRHAEAPRASSRDPTVPLASRALNVPRRMAQTARPATMAGLDRV